MSEKTILVEVTPKPRTQTQKAISQAVFWGFLLAATGGSRLLFGGAWVIDMFAAFFAIVWLLYMARGVCVDRYEFTPEQLRAWVKCGMPKGPMHTWMETET